MSHLALLQIGLAEEAHRHLLGASGIDSQVCAILQASSSLRDIFNIRSITDDVAQFFHQGCDSMS